ncbi:RNA-guided endonuclease InsQ/TnpB family protein [Streptomyces sp. NPDC057623]|uniref:RNA-guided endonuclease InsQ/TnpB family protein n=1 Tax=Streptomyces sp. NPDC057623 TaxID=3346187 RepID=UPI0036983B83
MSRAVPRYRGFRTRLALTPQQETRLDDQAHAARALWNLLHELVTVSGARRPPVAYLDGEVRWARTRVEWLGVLPAQAAQAVLKTYHRAWVNCWDGRAEAPTYKSRSRAVLAVDIPQGRDLHVVRVHRRWGMVNIPKLGRVRFRWTRELPGVTKGSPPGRITGARLTKDALGWHIAFRVETEAQTAPPRDWADSHVGIDRGIVIPLALSDGSTYEHRAWLTEEEEARLLRAQRQAAHRERHKKPGGRVSKRLRATYDQIKDLRARAKRRVLDWQHKTTTAIAETYTLVSVERLSVVNMIKSARGRGDLPGVKVAQKAGLNRGIAGEAWGRTVELLAYKVDDRGGRLVQVPSPGTSLRCSECGTVTLGSRESQQWFACRNNECQWSGNADFNASRNIDRAGLALVTVAGRAVVRQT